MNTGTVVSTTFTVLVAVSFIARSTVVEVYKIYVPSVLGLTVSTPVVTTVTSPDASVAVAPASVYVYHQVQL